MSDWPTWAADISKRLAAIEAKHRQLIEALPEAMARTAADIVERRLTAGVWSATASYKAGSLVTHAGSGWVATVHSKGLRPGQSDGWRLAIKGDLSHLRRAVEAECASN